MVLKRDFVTIRFVNFVPVDLGPVRIGVVRIPPQVLLANEPVFHVEDAHDERA